MRASSLARRKYEADKTFTRHIDRTPCRDAHKLGGDGADVLDALNPRGAGQPRLNGQKSLRATFLRGAAQQTLFLHGLPAEDVERWREIITRTLTRRLARLLPH